jgi:hypothetical protein
MEGDLGADMAEKGESGRDGTLITASRSTSEYARVNSCEAIDGLFERRASRMGTSLDGLVDAAVDDRRVGGESWCT